MATKPYPQTEETPCSLNEPAVEYHADSKYIPTPSVIESLCRAEEDYKAEWIRPHTLEEIHAICDEAEADDEAERLLNCDYVHSEMKRLNPWLCK